MSNATYHKTYGALVEDGKWFPSPAHLLRRAAILHEFGKYSGGKMLDIGCGAGRLLIDWHELGHVGYGIDADKNARDLSQECVDAFGAKFEIAAVPPKDKENHFDYFSPT